MIIWISGPYGVGKSTLAEAMAPKMENALIFDAELVGDAVRSNYPDDPYGYIYEDYPLWGEFCCKLLTDVHNTFHKDILVPMTLMRSASYDAIIQKLRDNGIETHLVVLEASYDSVHDRILARGEEEGCWCMENIAPAREGCSALPGIHINTDGVSVPELAELVLRKITENR